MPVAARAERAGILTGENVRAFVVNVSMEDDDPLIFGPYTRRKAFELADKFNEKIEAGAFDDRAFGWIHATAMRIDNPASVRGMLREFGK